MKPYSQLTKQELAAKREALVAQYEDFKRRGLKLNMTRGVPSLEQLALSSGILTCLGKDDYTAENGIDCRNYGVLDGIPEMKRIFADILELDPSEVIVGGNSSLSLMFDNISSNMSHGVRDGTPWSLQGKVKFLCPAPGYDRHFTTCDYFHIEMIPIEMTPDGPDMDTVERLVAADAMIKGMWCVPVFSNPTGAVYSDETVRRIAALKPAAPDFRLYWDNAYAIHQFSGGKRLIPNIVRECEKAGNEHMPLVFTSFSKVTFSGAAVSCMASSRSNCEFIKKRLSAQTIGPDKLRQLAHVRFLGDAQGVYAHMRKHAEILAPKFQLVGETLSARLGGLGVAEWSTPQGGYFVSFNSLPGCARRIAALCNEAGVALTPAGATYPHGKDPNDSNLRIAPTAPPIDELRTAMDVFCTAVLLASAEKLLGE
ncbi:MAG: aminotransferase class I/II-fold pyridoxal phosphate-dependent enzyme [Oscillospiraceae bacterium]|jgi:DNA-binding transcriptional MocR family regulator|nr:aminotransferase class I/II-fold pyridoxal phosphate-dependent enzyme [Oscillospiraceae bacterium]